MMVKMREAEKHEKVSEGTKELLRRAYQEQQGVAHEAPCRDGYVGL